MGLLCCFEKGVDLQQPVGGDSDGFGVHDVAAEIVLRAMGKAEDDHAGRGFDDAGGVAAARQGTVEEAGRYRPRSARVVGDQVTGAGDRGVRVAAALLVGPLMGGPAEQAIPGVAVLEDLGHFQLAKAAVKDRRSQGPGGEVGRGGEADGAAGVWLGHAGDAGGEIHQPAGAIGVAHHPGGRAWRGRANGR